jgi:hypothetical protein
MTAWLARVIVHLSSALVPRGLRAEWREEWLAELAALARAAKSGSRLTAHGSGLRAQGSGLREGNSSPSSPVDVCCPSIP